MDVLTYNIEIKAKAAKVWQMLWNDETYRIWTEAFQAGSYAVSDWKEGDKIQFLSPNGDGMYSKIVENKPNMLMSFKHIGNIKNFEEQPIDEETKEWVNSLEAYHLTETNGITKLDVSLNSVEQY